MIIVGAKGHAKDILSDKLFFSQIVRKFVFDDVTPNLSDVLFEDYKLLRTMDEAEFHTAKDDFIIALGLPKHRFFLFEKFVSFGFNPFSYIASNCYVSHLSKLGKGLNIMPFASVFIDAHIGNGSLINSYASVHHDVKIGDFTTVSPGARILGRVNIGSFVDIGANAVILPNVTIGSGVVVGAGAVVTKNLPDNCTAVGVPAKIIK